MIGGVRGFHLISSHFCRFARTLTLASKKSKTCAWCVRDECVMNARRAIQLQPTGPTLKRLNGCLMSARRAFVELGTAHQNKNPLERIPDRTKAHIQRSPLERKLSNLSSNRMQYVTFCCCYLWAVD